jgi:hypothetical protein
MGLFEDDIARDMQEDAEYASGWIEAKHEFSWGFIMNPVFQLSGTPETTEDVTSSAVKYNLSLGGVSLTRELYSSYVQPQSAAPQVTWAQVPAAA